MGSTNSETPSATSKTAIKPYGRVVLTTKNCLLPEEKLSVTPSEIDGLDRETETDLRIYGCELIQTAGILLKLPQVAMATGQVLLQRFYYSKSLVRHPIEHTAMGCVCLASKIEEAPRRVRDIINVFNHIKQVNSKKTIQPMILDQNYIALKTQVIKAERRVLKELGFCVHIKHPHKIIVMYLQVLSYEKNKTLMQIAWNYMNDSLRTDVFLRYQPEVIACACIYLTARKIKLPLPKSPAWYTIFGVTEKDIKDVCLRILRLYNRPKANIEMLEKKVEELCKKYQEAKLKARGVTSDGNAVTNCRSPVSPQQEVSSGGSHNAWGGFISRSGSHIAPPVITKDKPARSRSRSISPPPVSKHKSKRRNCKSYSKSRSRTPPSKQSRKSTKEKNQHKSMSRSHEERSFTYDKNDKYDKYADRDKYHRHSKDDRYIEYDKKESYNDKTDKNADKADKYYDKYIKDDKYAKDEKYTKDSRERDSRYKKSKHREDDRERSKDQRR